MMAGRIPNHQTMRSSHTMTAVTFMPQSAKHINQPFSSSNNQSNKQQSVNPTVNPSTQPPAPSASRVLEIGHVFTQHYLVDHQTVSRKVVIFVQSNTLFACVYQPNQTCYRNPVKRLVFNQAIEVLMGKQTTSLQLADDAIDRRCFTIRYKTNDQSINQIHQIELEAPGSGDVKYWLRCFLSLMTHQLSYKLHDNLHFINQPVYSSQSLIQCETRLRQARFDSQYVRRKEEAVNRYNVVARVTIEHKRDWTDRASEIAARGEAFVVLAGAIDMRVTSAVDGPSRVRCEDNSRRDAIKRMIECRQSELQFIQAVHQANSQSVKSLAAANKRSSSLVTHVNNPLFQPRSTNTTPILNTRSLSGIHSSKSYPNLPASTPTSPHFNSRRLSGPVMSDTPSPQPPQQLRLLPTVLPSRLNRSVDQSNKQSNNQSSPVPSLIHCSSSPLPSTDSNRSVQAQERMIKLAVPPMQSVAPVQPQIRPISVPVIRSNNQTNNPSLHSVFPFASNPAFSHAYHSLSSEQSQRTSVRPTYFMPKVSTQPSMKPYHTNNNNMFSESVYGVPSLPMTQVYRFQAATDPFDKLASLKQAAPMPEPVQVNLPAAHFTVPHSTSFSIHVSVNANQLVDKTTKPAITVSVTAQDTDSECHDAPPSYESLTKDCFSYA